MGKVYLVFRDGGHGDQTPGKRTPFLKSLGRQVREHEFNQPVTDYLGDELKRHGIETFDVATGPDDVPLSTRTKFANTTYWSYCAKYGAENVVAVYVSIHFNAHDGVFNSDSLDPSGFSVHIQPGLINKSAGKLAQLILDELKNGTKQINRGIVEQDLHVTRETVMPAVLTECGFMDNEREAFLMLDNKFQKEIAIEHAKGILKYFGLEYKEKVKLTPIAKDDITGHWAEGSIRKAILKQALTGFEDGTFRPNEPLTRAQLCSILDRLGVLG